MTTSAQQTGDRRQRMRAALERYAAVDARRQAAARDRARTRPVWYVLGRAFDDASRYALLLVLLAALDPHMRIADPVRQLAFVGILTALSSVASIIAIVQAVYLPEPADRTP